MSSRFFEGHLDSKLDLYCIKETLFRHIREKSSIFPQKYLYVSPDGASLWSLLTRNALSSVYQNFPFGRQGDQLSRDVLSALHEGPASNLGIIALGCGEGIREKVICRTIVDQLAAKNLEVALVDISSDLLASAARNFADLPRCKVQYFQTDFESLDALKQIRKNLKARRTLVLFLGNTLGNLDERQMIVELSEALHPRDLVFVEVLLHRPNDMEKLRASEYSAQDDPRIEFVTNPLFLLGRQPRPENIERQISGKEKGVISRRYRYRFSKKESGEVISAAAGSSLTLSPVSYIDLLEIKSQCEEYFQKTVEMGFSLTSEIRPITYDSGTGHTVTFGYATAVKEVSRKPTDIPTVDRHEKKTIEMGQWADLVLALDHRTHDLYAISSSANLACLKGRQLVKINKLAGSKQWKKVARKFGESPSGTVRIDDLARDFGWVVDIENPIKYKRFMKRIANALSDLNRKMREALTEAEVMPESKIRLPLLSKLSDTEITCACLIGFLTKDEKGILSVLSAYKDNMAQP
jgi:hypothetical protein